MARRYVRDNRGRFASTGTGATARGGRLKTAAGNKRATQTISGAKRASPSGTIRTTDVNKAKVHNFMSKMVENNQARYDKAAIDRNRFPRAENKTTRLIAAQNRVAGQNRAASGSAPKTAAMRKTADRIEASGVQGRTKTGGYNPTGNAGAGDVARKIRAKADRLDAIDSANAAAAAGRAATAAKQARPTAATGTRRDANRLRTLNNRLAYQKKQGATPDDAIMQATSKARNTLASSMVSQGGQRVQVRSRSEAARAQRARSANMLSAGNARANTREGGVSVLTSGGYGVPRKYGNVEDRMLMSRRKELKQPGAKETFVPVRAGAGARIRGRTTATQPSLLGGPAKELKVFRKAPRAKGRR